MNYVLHEGTETGKFPYLAWNSKNHQKIEKRKKRNMQQDTKMPNPKQEYFCKFHYFFTLFQNPGVKCLFLRFFAKRMFFGKKLTAYW